MTLLALWFALHPISLKVYPPTGFAPLTVRIEARLMPIESDRRVKIIVESETFYTSTECPLEGLDSAKRCPVIKPLYLDLREPGIYTIAAGIGPFATDDRFRATDRVSVEVR